MGDLQSLALASRHTHPNSITYKIDLIGLHLTTSCPESSFSHVDDKSEHQERLLNTSYRKLPLMQKTLNYDRIRLPTTFTNHSELFYSYVAVHSTANHLFKQFVLGYLYHQLVL